MRKVSVGDVGDVACVLVLCNERYADTLDFVDYRVKFGKSLRLSVVVSAVLAVLACGQNVIALGVIGIGSTADKHQLAAVYRVSNALFRKRSLYLVGVFGIGKQPLFHKVVVVVHHTCKRLGVRQHVATFERIAV